jgi:hypothetical protein
MFVKDMNIFVQGVQTKNQQYLHLKNEEGNRAGFLEAHSDKVEPEP